jgi:hypothetical protein
MLVAVFWASQSGSGPYLVEDVFKFVLRQSRALDIFDCSKLSCHPLAVLALDRCHPLLCQLVFYRGVLPQIHLRADNQTRNPWTVVVYLGKPLFADVLEGCGRCDGKAHKEYIGLGVREGAETVVIFLSSGIEQTEGVGLITNP